MSSFVLQTNYFEFNGIVKLQISGTAIGAKFSTNYICIFMDKLETDLLNKQDYLPLAWYQYIDDFSFGHTVKKTLNFF